MSSSARLCAGFKDSKCEESKSVWVNGADRKLPPRTQFSLLFFYRLAPCFFVLFSQSSSSKLIFYPSIDSDEQKWKKEKKQSEFWGSSLSDWILPICQGGQGGRHVSDWSLSLIYNLFLWGQRLHVFSSFTVPILFSCSSYETGVTPVIVPSPTSVFTGHTNEPQNWNLCALSPSSCQV